MWGIARDERREIAGGPPTVSRPARRRRSASVPQWIGTATRGRIRAAACAARTGSRWPGPSTGPQPGTPAKARRRSCRRAPTSHRRGLCRRRSSSTASRRARTRQALRMRPRASGASRVGLASRSLAPVRRPRPHRHPTPARDGTRDARASQPHPWVRRWASRCRSGAATEGLRDRRADARARPHRCARRPPARTGAAVRRSRPTRLPRTGSVRIRTPSSSTSAVAWPTQVIGEALSLGGFTGHGVQGVAGGGA